MVEPQPLKKPEWNTGGSNRTEPASGEKVSGWVLNDQPPSSYFNWLQYYTYAWLKWLNERVLKGSNEVDLVVNALTPDATGAGGDLTLEAGDGLTTGAGGSVAINAGDGAGAAAGGSVAIAAGAPDTSGGGGGASLAAGAGIGAEGGDLSLSAGASDSDGGDVTVDAGANTSSGPGGDLTLAAGNAVGGNAGDASFKAGTANSPGPGQGGDLTLAAGDGFKEKGGDASLAAGDADGTGATANGGAVTVAAGSGGVLGLGGAVTIQTGSSGTDYSGDLTMECLAGKDGGGSARLSAGDGWGPGGAVTIEGGDSTVNNNGGALDLDAGDATGSSGDGGAVTVNAGDGPDAGGAVTIEGGNATTSGAGGDVDLNGGNGLVAGKGGNIDGAAGDGVGALGGSVRLDAGPCTSGAFDGGVARLRAGAAQGTGDGGDAQLWAGSQTGSSGDGGNADIRGGAAAVGAGGDVDIDAGSSASGLGGDVLINAGAGVGAEGGDLTAAAGNSDTDGGDASLTAGDCTGTGDGGDLTLAAGDGKGTDKDSGDVSISTGDSTGTGFGQVSLKVAEGASSTGSGVNTAAEYIKCDGDYSKRQVEVNRFVELQQTVDTGRGQARIIARTAQPSAPSAGDIWHDNANKQLKIYNGSRHAAMNQLFWNATEQEMFAEISQNILSPPAALSVSTNYVMHERPYSGGVSTTNAFKADLLANAMREGAILRVRAHFVLSTDGTPPATRWTPDIVIMLGSVGSGAPFTGSTGDALGDEGSFGADEVWARCAVECEGRYWEASSIDYLDVSSKYLFEEDAASPNPLSSLVKLGGSVNNLTFAPGFSLEVFPRVDFGPFDANWKVECEQFVVELL